MTTHHCSSETALKRHKAMHPVQEKSLTNSSANCSTTLPTLSRPPPRTTRDRSCAEHQLPKTKLANRRCSKQLHGQQTRISTHTRAILQRDITLNRAKKNRLSTPIAQQQPHMHGADHESTPPIPITQETELQLTRYLEGHQLRLTI